MPPLSNSNLHPEATGAAQELVANHQSEHPLKLYAGWFCPFVQRVWIALEERQIPYQYIEVNPYHKPESLLALNPRGLVPSMIVPDSSNPSIQRPLYESTVLLEYLEDAYPNYRPQLLPTEPYPRARARIWIDYITSRIIPAFYRFLQFQPPEGKSADAAGQALDKERQEFLYYLKEWAKEMDAEGPFFMGKDISLPDVALAPWAIRLWVFDTFKEGGLGMPASGQGGPDEAIWERWRKWLSAIQQRKSIIETTSEKDYYFPVYKRYADNTAQSELAKATRARRGVP